MGYNDNLRSTLNGLGYEGNINDMLYAMYTDNGYSGSLNDKAKQARIASGSKAMFPIIDPVSERLIPQFNGTGNYGVFDSTITLQAGDSIEVVFAPHNLTGAQHFIDSEDATDRGITFLNDVTGTVSYVAQYTPVLLNGVSIASNAVAPLLNKENTIVYTTDRTTDIKYIAANYLAGNKLAGHILSIKTIISSVETEYVLNTKTPTGITYTNFADVDWHNYLYDSDLSRWDYQGSGAVGSQLIEFTGHALTPLSASITVTGSTWEMNWEGLWVEHYISGVGAYTYLTVPDGVPMRLDIHDIANTTQLTISNLKMTGATPDLSGLTSLIGFSAQTNRLTDFTPSTIAPTLTSLLMQTGTFTTAAVDQALSDVADSVALSTRVGTLNVSGGANGAPTDGAANVDVVYLQGQGWTVTHN